jgi:hypothetical protein
MQLKHQLATRVFAAELEEAFERGRNEGLPFKGLPSFAGWSQPVGYQFSRSHFDSYLAYERDVRRALRSVQCGRAHELERCRALQDARRARLVRHQRQVLRLSVAVKRIEAELLAVRKAVDAELETGRGHACTVAAMRVAPNRPVGVREFPSVSAFVEEDRRRAPAWPERMAAGGSDHGHHWRLENPIRRWLTTRWRLSWLCMGDPTYEVYAVEFTDEDSQAGPLGRVWLLGVVNDEKVFRQAISELELHAQRERNSLVVIAERVRDTAAGQSAPPVA